MAWWWSGSRLKGASKKIYRSRTRARVGRVEIRARKRRRRTKMCAILKPEPVRYVAALGFKKSKIRLGHATTTTVNSLVHVTVA